MENLTKSRLRSGNVQGISVLKAFFLLMLLGGCFNMANGQTAFTAGNLVVEKLGTGTSILTSGSCRINFVELTTGGTVVQTIIPDTTKNGATGRNTNTKRAIVESGSAASAGHITLSADGRYLVFIGYDTITGVSTLVSTTSYNNVNRVVGFINSSGVESTPTWFTNAATGAYKNNNIRGVCSDGNGIWVSGADGNATSPTGIHYTATTNNTSSVGGTLITTAATAITNSRSTSIYKGQLYLSTGSGTSGVYAVGSGKPTSGSGSTLIAAASDPYDFVLLDVDPTVAGPDLMYIANQSGTGGSILKYSYNGTVWTARGQSATGSASSATSLVAAMNSSGTIDLYAVVGPSGAATGNDSIVKFTDGAARTANISLGSRTFIKAAGTDFVFRGLSWAPTTSSAISSYSVSPANGATIASGNYYDITIGNGVTATLGGNITINGTLTVQSGGTLICGANVISSPPGSYGTFDLQSGGTLKIGSTAGITNYAASGNIQTFSRFYNAGANYVYNGSAAQVTGDGLPATVNTLTLANATGLTLSGNVAATNGTTITSGSIIANGHTATTSAAATILYNGTSAQTVGMEWSNTISNPISITNTAGVTLGANVTGYSGTITVAAGAVLNTSTFSIAGTGSISFASGSTLTTANTNGVGTSNNAGIQLSGTVTYSSSMNFVFNGSSAQVSGTDIPATMSSLTLTNSAGLTLNKTITVTGATTLNAGIIKLGSNNMIVGSSGSISGVGPSKYIFTDGTGYLEMTASHTGGTVFPVGDAYNPIMITPTTDGVFDVSVANGVTDKNGTAIANHAVGVTWTVQLTSSAQNVTLTPQWNLSDELTSFDRANSYVAIRTSQVGGDAGAVWAPTASAAGAGGSDPYTQNSGTIAMAPGTTYYIGLGDNGPSPLPVHLISFTVTAENNIVSLKWATASELNNSHFDIERSVDGNKWETIGTVAGHGNAQMVNNYGYADNVEAIISPALYYRLKQFDFNGAVNYSAIRSVNLNGINNVDIFPNPASGRLNMSFTSVYEGDATMRITDMSGRVLQKANLSLLKGKVTKGMDINMLQKGNYIISIETPSSRQFYYFSKTE